MIEAIVKDQWHDCKIVKVIPPTEEEIKTDLAEDEEEKRKEENEEKKIAEQSTVAGSPKKKKEKEKKAFSPPDHLFKYQVMKIEPEDHEVNDVSMTKYCPILVAQGVSVSLTGHVLEALLSWGKRKTEQSSNVHQHKAQLLSAKSAELRFFKVASKTLLALSLLAHS